MGRVQLLRGREREGASAKGFCVSACARVCLSPDQKLNKGQMQSEDGSLSEVDRPKFTPSRSYTFIRQLSEICAGFPHYSTLCWSCGILKKYVQNMCNL